MFRTILATGAAAVALTTALATAAPAPLLAQDTASLSAPQIEFTEWTLDNGLRVIAIPDDSTGQVTTSLWYEVGSKHDPEGRSGFAHLFEHILSRKTENMFYNQIYGLTADVGGTRNASTGSDRTNYYETVPAAYLETMLWTHRERMFKPVVDQEVFDRERDVVKEELRQRVLAPPYGRFQRFVLAENAYDVLPQRRPGIGSIEDLDSATLDDARAFHQAYYGPDTATLIVAGNFEMANLRALVDEYFADIPRRANPVDLTISAREPQRTQPRSFVATAPNVPLPVAGTLWKGPGAGEADAAALDVMAAVMARGQNSRLYDALVRSGQAVDASLFYSESEEGGFIASFAITNPQADADAVEATLRAALDRIRSAPVTAAELAEAKSELFSDSLRRRETARGRAFELGEALVSTGNPRAAAARLEAIGRVTAADVQRVAAKWMDPQARVDMRYVAGEENPAAYANPVPMPTFRSLPAATGEPLAVLPEGQRQEPPGPGMVPSVERAEIVEQNLANGVSVVAAQTGNVPIATMTVLVPGGSISDPRMKAGLANMAASIADQGEVLASVIKGATYPEDAFERERKRAIDGLAVSLKDPGALASMVARPVLYGDAPYGTLPGGTQASLASLTREDLIAHRETYWHPARTKVIVSGGIAPDQAVALTNALFGNWQVASAPPAEIAQPTGAGEPVRTVVIDMPDAGQAAVYAGLRAPSRTDGDYYALEIANAILGGGSSGRLFEEVRTKRSISYGAGSGLITDRLVASSQTQNATAEEVVQVFLDEFDRLGSEAVADDLLNRRRLYLGGNYARSLETSGGFNAIVANLILDGLEPAEAARYADRLQAVSPEAAAKAAADYVTADKASIIVVGNAAEFLDDLRAIRPDVEVIPAASLDLSSKDLGLD